MKASQTYPLVGLAPAGVMPPRTTLVRLEPRGLGTSDCESLRSYFLRLADAHSVTPASLTSEIVLPHMDRGQAAWWSRNYLGTSHYLCGTGHVAEAWSKALGELTGFRGLSELTLVQLRDLIPERGLVTRERRWCPACFQDDMARGTPPFGRLLWEIGEVTACPKHGRRLVTTCGCTGTPVQMMFKKALPWVCARCGYPLARPDECRLAKSTAEEDARARLVADLIETPTAQIQLDAAQEKFGAFLKQVIDEHFDGNSAHLARALGVGKSLLHGWTNSHHAASLANLLNVARLCGVTLRTVLFDGNASRVQSVADSTSRNRTNRTPIRRRRALNRDRIRLALEDISTCAPPISFRHAARSLSIEVNQLRRMFPEFAKKISGRYLAHKAEQDASRFRQRMQLWEETAAKLVASGIRPTRGKVAAALAGVDVIIRLNDRKACAAICRAVIAAGGVGQ